MDFLVILLSPQDPPGALFVAEAVPPRPCLSAGGRDGSQTLPGQQTRLLVWAGAAHDQDPQKQAEVNTNHPGKLVSGVWPLGAQAVLCPKLWEPCPLTFRFPVSKVRGWTRAGTSA